jgi:hypothetical protein
MACGQAAATHSGFGATRNDAATDPVAQAAPTPAAATATKSPAKPLPASGGPQNGYPQYMQGTIPARVTVSLASACVRPGFTQQLTIQTTPGFYASFDTQYADKKEGSAYGGKGYGPVPTGGYVMRWLVDPSTPAGTATVFVAVEGGKPMQTAFRQPTFQVGSC